jgi:hypothetical protein
LYDKYNWKFCYFIGSESEKKRTLEKFPDAIFHLKNQAKKNEKPPECRKIKQAPLDKSLLTALSFHETIFLKMMDRYNIDGSFTYQKRLFYYHTQVMFWKGMLDHFKPDVIIFRIAPHMGFDYVLYALCDVMGIKTIMFERTSLPGLIYPVESFERGSEIIRHRYREMIKEDHCKDYTLSDETLMHLKNLKKSYDQAQPFHLKQKLAKFRKSGALESPLAAYFLTLKVIVKGILTRSDKLKKSYYQNIANFKKRRLHSYYNQIAKDVDLERPYIFVALQCEPERQTCPSGGVFGNQYIMIDLLSKLIPEGWMIYVKEHISQFKSYQNAHLSRTAGYYDYISSLPNVKLVPLSYTSFDLIDKSIASATVSGTVGWESVVRGKPSLLFGYSWYRDCEGVFVTHSVDDCKKALQHLQNGYRIKKDNVILFAHVIEKFSFNGYIDEVYSNMKHVTYEQNVANISSHMADFLNSSNFGKIEFGQE